MTCRKQAHSAAVAVDGAAPHHWSVTGLRRFPVPPPWPDYSSRSNGVAADGFRRKRIELTNVCWLCRSSPAA